MLTFFSPPFCGVDVKALFEGDIAMASAKAKALLAAAMTDAATASLSFRILRDLFTIQSDRVALRVRPSCPGFCRVNV